MTTQNKAIGGAVGAAIGASPIGDAVAQIFLWMLNKAGLVDVPQEAVQVLIVALVAYACIYISPKNREA